MNVILIHSVRTKAYGKLEPVGVWEVTEEGHRCFYSEGREKYEERGKKALLDQPGVPLMEWAHFRAETSPNWRILAPLDTTLVGEPPADLSAVLAAERAKFLEHVAHSMPAPRPAGDLGVGTPSRLKSVDGARIIANSWWLAGELVRRHPELVAYEMHPGGGMYDVLTVTHPREVSPGALQEGPQIMMNRAGTVHVSGPSATEKKISWTDVDHHRSSVLHILEDALGFASTAPASATGRSLVYRFLASALDLFVTDKHWWDVRCEFLDTVDAYETDDPGRIRAFPSAMEAQRSIEPLGIYGEPLSHFFTLLRDEEPIVIASLEGSLHRKTEGPIDLTDAYAKHGRRIRWMTASLLRDWL